MRKTLLVVLALCLLSSCGELTYMDGPKEDRFSIGKIQGVDEFKLRELGEKMQKELVEFNYKLEIDGRINLLDVGQRDYKVTQAENTGPATTNSKDLIKPGEVEVRFDNGSSGLINLVSLSWSAFELSGELRPPQAQQGDLASYRPNSKEIAVKVANEWFTRLGYNMSNFDKGRATIKSETTPVLVKFFEVLPDKNITSPNYLGAEVDFWGMLSKFTIHVAKTPIISTKPTIDRQMAITNVKMALGIDSIYEMMNPPILTIDREYEKKDNELYAKDRLVWFFDLTAEQLNIQNRIIKYDAHAGELVP